MLVLSRKKDERLVVHRNGEVLAVLTVIEVRGDKIRVGGELPPDVTLDREEVFTSKTGRVPSVNQRAVVV